jgi:hypothetical protein
MMLSFMKVTQHTLAQDKDKKKASTRLAIKVILEAM